MITAREASKLYDGNLLLRDKYIEEVIEPLIKENATTSKSVKIPMRGRYMSAPSIDFPRTYAKYKVNVELTDKIIKTLKENGYNVHTMCASGTEGFDGEGELIISWD